MRLRIANCELRIGASEFSASQSAFSLVPGSLAVPETTPWWQTIMRAAEDQELEMIRGAYNVSANVQMCANAVSNAEGVKLFRERLQQLRQEAISKKPEDAGQRSEVGGRKSE